MAEPEAKTGYSSKLMQMKFMQRRVAQQAAASAQAQRQAERNADADVADWTAPPGEPLGCRVIVEGDPQPAVAGRMTFPPPQEGESQAAEGPSTSPTKQSAAKVADVPMTERLPSKHKADHQKAGGLFKRPRR